MQYTNLIYKISDLDKKRIENYIYKYGIRPKYYIGTDKWLSNWSHSKQKLYKLLGNNLIYKKEVTLNKSDSELNSEIVEKLLMSDFKTVYHRFYHDYIFPLYEKDIFTMGQKSFFNHLLDREVLKNNSTIEGIKYKAENKKKMLNLQEGMKVMKAVQKVVDYFYDDYFYQIPNIKEILEKFRIDYSMILNDKICKGNLCLSIHPLDFITMSDNDSSWSSCMSWVDDGCYHTGTVEMMNSNNVICCYLEASSPFVFNKNEALPADERTWNNKKWRVLAYITKDIIMSGKPYPYVNEELSKIIITELKNLAEINLNWTYSFGPELYQDMKYIHSYYTMNRARRYMANKNTNFKHNIIWDTHGMYNDMLNDSYTHYWCYRNKVEHTKILSVSGKAPCLCCGEEVLKERNVSDEYYDSYNERYYDTHATICENCEDEFSLTCDQCGEKTSLRKPYFKLVDENNKDIRTLCPNCFTDIKLCACCGRPIYSRTDVYKKISFGLISKKNFNSLKNNPTIRQREIDVEGYGKVHFYHPYDICEYYDPPSRGDSLIKTLKQESPNLQSVPLCKECFEKYDFENITEPIGILKGYSFGAGILKPRELVLVVDIDQYPYVLDVFPYFKWEIIKDYRIEMTKENNNYFDEIHTVKVKPAALADREIKFPD